MLSCPATLVFASGLLDDSAARVPRWGTVAASGPAAAPKSVHAGADLERWSATERAPPTDLLSAGLQVPFSAAAPASGCTACIGSCGTTVRCPCTGERMRGSRTAVAGAGEAVAEGTVGTPGMAAAAAALPLGEPARLPVPKTAAAGEGDAVAEGSCGMPGMAANAVALLLGEAARLPVPRRAVEAGGDAAARGTGGTPGTPATAAALPLGDPAMLPVPRMLDAVPEGISGMPGKAATVAALPLGDPARLPAPRVAAAAGDGDAVAEGGMPGKLLTAALALGEPTTATSGAPGESIEGPIAQAGVGVETTGSAVGAIPAAGCCAPACATCTAAGVVAAARAAAAVSGIEWPAARIRATTSEMTSAAQSLTSSSGSSSLRTIWPMTSPAASAAVATARSHANRSAALCGTLGVGGMLWPPALGPVAGGAPGWEATKLPPPGTVLRPFEAFGLKGSLLTK